MLSPPPERITFDLFIGNEYWRLKSSDSTHNFELQFEDKTRESRATKLRADLQMGTSFPKLNRKFNESLAVFFSVIFELKFLYIISLSFICNRALKSYSLGFLKTTTKRTEISSTTKKFQILRFYQQFQPTLQFQGSSDRSLP